MCTLYLLHDYPQEMQLGCLLTLEYTFEVLPLSLET